MTSAYTLDDLQARVIQLNQQIGGNWAAEWQLLWIVEEIGEVSRALQKLENLPAKLFDEDQRALQDNLKEEVGDVLYGLISFCNTVNLDIKESLLYSIEKFEERHSVNP